MALKASPRISSGTTPTFNTHRQMAVRSHSPAPPYPSILPEATAHPTAASPPPSGISQRLWASTQLISPVSLVGTDRERLSKLALRKRSLLGFKLYPSFTILREIPAAMDTQILHPMQLQQRSEVLLKMGTQLHSQRDLRFLAHLA